MSLSELMRSDPRLANKPADRERLDEMRRAKAERRLREMAWEPNGGQAHLVRMTRIDNQMVQDGMSLWFSRAQSALYMTQSYLPFITDSEHSASVSRVIKDMLGKLEKEMRDEHARADAMIEAEGYTEEKRSNNAMEIPLAVYTPEAERFRRLALQFDDLIWKLSVLWINGRIDAQQDRAMVWLAVQTVFMDRGWLSSATRQP